MKGYKNMGDGIMVSRGGKIWSERSHRFIATGERATLDYEGVTVIGYQLIAEAFCDKPAGATVVHHINGNPNDNRASNLMWCTPEEHALIHQIMREEMLAYFAKKAVRTRILDKVKKALHR